VHRQEAREAKARGMTPISYLVRLGLVIGMIDEGLVYEQTTS
jgi:hypothetical protein